MLNRLLHALLGAVFIFSLALSGCAGHKQRGAPAPKAEPVSQADSTKPGVVVQPPRSILDKLTGRTPAPAYYPPGTPVVVKGKKNTLTINHVAGSQSNQTNTAGKSAAAGTGATAGGKADGPVAGAGADLDNIEKAKAPVTTGTGDATDNTKQAQRGGAAATGDGATATATTVKPPTPWLKYGLWAAGALGGYWLLFGGGGALLLALWRKNKFTNTTA